MFRVHAEAGRRERGQDMNEAIDQRMNDQQFKTVLVYASALLTLVSAASGPSSISDATGLPGWLARCFGCMPKQADERVGRT